MKRRVVITGVGAITPIGIGKEEFWNNLVAGNPALARLPSLMLPNTVLKLPLK